MLVPILSFPTTIVIIDDDKTFAHIFAESLSSRYTVKVFTEAHAALDFLLKYQQPLDKTRLLYGLTEHEDYNSLDKSIVALDFKNILDIADLPNLHEQVSIVISDDKMPDMCGVDLFKRLHNDCAWRMNTKTKFKCVLLTGHEDQHLALEALNNKWLDLYITKQNNATNSIGLYERIDNLTKQYFYEFSCDIMNYLQVEHSIPLTDIEFADFFNKFVVKNNIREFYLADKQGSFLLIDGKGQRSMLFVSNDKHLDDFAELYMHTKDMSPYIAALQSRQIMPTFPVGYPPEAVQSHYWGNYMVAPNILKTENTHYYWYHKVLA